MFFIKRNGIKLVYLDGKLGILGLEYKIKVYGYFWIFFFLYFFISKYGSLDLMYLI